MARSRAVQFADSWKERRQQPQPNKQLRKFGAVVWYSIKAWALQAQWPVPVKRLIGSTLLGRAPKQKFTWLLLTWHSLLALGMSVVRAGHR